MAEGGTRRRGRPAATSSDDTRAAIIASAHKLFGEAGYGGVSMERLAVEADLTVRALYHYFPSKRELFRAAGDDALGRFGTEVAARVFVHDSLRDRVRGYIDVYRSLYRTDRDALRFIGMDLVDALSSNFGAPSASDTGDVEAFADASEPLRLFLEILVDQALARAEVHAEIDREGAMLLLSSLGTGLALAALNDDGGTFLAMLDAFDRLTDGTLFT